MITKNNFTKKMIERIMLKKLKGNTAEVAIFAGSGLDAIIDMEITEKISYKRVGFNCADLPGHERFFQFGTFNGKKIVKLSRFHLYEDGSYDNIVMLFELLKDIGVKDVIATTATGAINKEYKPGEIMLIKSHINLSGTNPMVGYRPIQFVDLTNAYDRDLREEVKKIAKKKKIALREGVHIQVIGPSYETPAEVEAYRSLGADSVSMSGAYVCILANYFDMRFVEFASITNEAANYESEPITHDEVLRVSKLASDRLKRIIEPLIDKL